MLKRKTKNAASGKPSKLPIPRRVPVAEAPAQPAKAKASKPAVTAREPEPARVTEAPAEAAPAPAAATRTTAATPTAGKRSCLDAAVEVLRAAAEPMRCQELVAAMRAKGLWTSAAPTPHQTLASALLREITKKGPASRFRRADRGQFALAADPA
jgi:hypothetical protein